MYHEHPQIWTLFVSARPVDTLHWQVHTNMLNLDMRCTFRLVRDYRLVPAVLFVEECCVEARKLTVAKNGNSAPKPVVASFILLFHVPSLMVQIAMLSWKHIALFLFTSQFHLLRCVSPGVVSLGSLPYNCRTHTNSQSTHSVACSRSPSFRWWPWRILSMTGSCVCLA